MTCASKHLRHQLPSKAKECESGPKRVPVLEVRWVRFARQTGFGAGKTAAFEGVETLELA